MLDSWPPGVPKRPYRPPPAQQVRGLRVPGESWHRPPRPCVGSFPKSQSKREKGVGIWYNLLSKRKKTSQMSLKTNSSMIAKRRGVIVMTSVARDHPMKGLSGDEGSWVQRRRERQPRVFPATACRSAATNLGTSGGVSPGQEEGDAPEGSPRSEVAGSRCWVPDAARPAQGSFAGGRRPHLLRAIVAPGGSWASCPGRAAQRPACRCSALGVGVSGSVGADARRR